MAAPRRARRVFAGYRSAKNGRYVTKRYATANPNKVVRETKRKR